MFCRPAKIDVRRISAGENCALQLQHSADQLLLPLLTGFATRRPFLASLCGLAPLTVNVTGWQARDAVRRTEEM